MNRKRDLFTVKYYNEIDYYEGCYCPVCDDYFEPSSYLRMIFNDRAKAMWLANFITHYRHEHTKWDAGKYKLNGNKVSYEKSKIMINEYIKQLLIRKYTQFLKENEITLQVFEGLQHTTKETINLYNKIILTNQNQ